MLRGMYRKKEKDLVRKSILLSIYLFSCDYEIESPFMVHATTKSTPPISCANEGLLYS